MTTVQPTVHPTVQPTVQPTVHSPTPLTPTPPAPLAPAVGMVVNFRPSGPIARSGNPSFPSGDATKTTPYLAKITKVHNSTKVDLTVTDDQFHPIEPLLFGEVKMGQNPGQWSFIS